MSEGTIGILVLITISVIVSLIVHHKIHDYILAIVISVIISCISFQIAAYLHAGYLDPFFLIAVATSSIIIAVISSLVGLPFYIKRKNNYHP